jgi:hypothetical protein
VLVKLLQNKLLNDFIKRLYQATTSYSHLAVSNL